MAIGPETPQARDKRHYQRALFGAIADRYQDSRPGYTDSVLAFIAATARLGAGSPVLEVGCGTGQLTQPLAALGVNLTAIDIAPSMVAAARRQLAASAVGFPAVEFQVTSFEGFATGDCGRSGAHFDLIISGAAFHWIDPEVRFGKAARLLRPGGWLALAGSQDRYDDPVGAGLAALWAARDDSGGAWLNAVPERQAIAATGLFAEAVGRRETQRLTLPAGTVLDVERTRATYLSWPEGTRREFTAELAKLLRPHPEISLTRWTTVTMAQTMP